MCTLVDGELKPGKYTEQLETDIAPGIYFIYLEVKPLTSSSQKLTRKLILF